MLTFGKTCSLVVEKPKATAVVLSPDSRSWNFYKSICREASQSQDKNVLTGLLLLWENSLVLWGQNLSTQKILTHVSRKVHILML